MVRLYRIYIFLVFKVLTPAKHYHIQVTFNMLQITGEYRGNCRFAGLAIYQGQREDLLFCSNRSLWDKEIINITGHQQTFISNSNNLTIVLFSVKTYTLATVSLTTSECEGVSINPCEYHIYCHINVKDTRACQSYLRSISSHQIKFYKRMMRSIEPNSSTDQASYMDELLVLKQLDEACIQLHVSTMVVPRSNHIFYNNYYNLFSNAQCKVILTSHLSKQTADYGIHVTSTGSLQIPESSKLLITGFLMKYRYLHKINQSIIYTSKEPLPSLINLWGTLSMKVTALLMTSKSVRDETYSSYIF